MKILSVNVGLPRIVEYRGEPVATGIFKEPVAGRIAVGAFNLAGDGQADLRVHGGRAKAVYVYPSEHYEFWKNELSETDLPFGAFGENLTSEGMLETDARVGDCLEIGTARFVVTQPRQPCFKLGIRLNRQDIVKRFAQSGRAGFYLSIERTGELGANDCIKLISREPKSETIAAVVNRRFSL